MSIAPIDFRFDAGPHEYRVDGRIVPTVTEITDAISPMTGFVSPQQLEYSRALGRAVHRATELDDTGSLDESTVDADVMPRLKAWRRFRSAFAFEPEHIECRVYHGLYAYAGTFDRLGTLQFIGKPKRSRVLLDLKSGAESAIVDVQLAGYRKASIIDEIGGFILPWGPVDELLAVYLDARGNYRIRRVENIEESFAAFLSMLNIFRWRARHA